MPLVQPRRRFHERALAVCFKIRLFSLPLFLPLSLSMYMYISLSPCLSLFLPRGMQLILFPFDLLPSRGARAKGMSSVVGRSVADLMKYDL